MPSGGDTLRRATLSQGMPRPRRTLRNSDREARGLGLRATARNSPRRRTRTAGEETANSG